MQIDKDIYNAARYKLQKMIINKKRAFLENKLTESIGKPKDLWKALRSLGLPSKTSSCEVNALKINNKVEHDFNSVLGFKNYYSTLAENLVKMLRKPTNKYSINSKEIIIYAHRVYSLLLKLEKKQSIIFLLSLYRAARLRTSILLLICVQFISQLEATQI